MSVKATNEYVYDALNAAVPDEVSVWQGIQAMDDDAEVTVPVVVFQRQASTVANTLDNGTQIVSYAFNIVMVDETSELVTNIEDALRNALQTDPQVLSVFGGTDIPPSEPEKPFVRTMGIDVLAQRGQ